MAKAQNHKVVLSSHNRAVNPPPSTNGESSDKVTPRTDENGFTIPTYRIVHRGDFDIQDCTNPLVQQVRSMRPKELVVEIDLPLCASSSNVDLDVCERTLKLHCNSPKYSLDLHLPYPVRESDSHARFDKKQRKLLVTLAVIKEVPSIIEMDSNVEMEEKNDEKVEDEIEDKIDEKVEEKVEEEPAKIDLPVATTEEASFNENSANILYSPIPFEYKQGLARLALVLYVKNIDTSSLKVENDGQHITIRLISLGSGSYPLYHQLCLDFDEPMVFDTNEGSSNITFNDDNVLILLKKTSNDKYLTQFSSGVNRDSMKVNYFLVSFDIVL